MNKIFAHFSIGVINLTAFFALKESIRILFLVVPGRSVPVFDICKIIKDGVSLNAFSLLNLLIVVLSAYILLSTLLFYRKLFTRKEVFLEGFLKRIGFTTLLLIITILFVVTSVIIEI